MLSYAQWIKFPAAITSRWNVVPQVTETSTKYGMFIPEEGIVRAHLLVMLVYYFFIANRSGMARHNKRHTGMQ